MAGYDIIGNEVLKDGRVVERCETRRAALDRGHELNKNESAGKKAAAPTGVRSLSAVPWRDVLKVRPAGLWSATWNEGAGVAVNQATGAMANLTRDELEARFILESGGEFEPGPGGGGIVELKTFEAMRVEGPIVGQDGASYGPGTYYVVKDEAGREEVLSQGHFANRFTVIETPKPAAKAKAGQEV